MRSLKLARTTMILGSECNIAAKESEYEHLPAYLTDRWGEYLETLGF